MDHQDWNPVTIRSSARIAAAGKKEIVPKRSSDAQRLAKIEKEEYVKPKMLSSESRQELVQRRLAEKLTQQQLDRICDVMIAAYNITTNDRYFGCMPMWHAHGQTWYWATLRAGCDTAFGDISDVRQIECFQPTFLSGITWLTAHIFFRGPMNSTSTMVTSWSNSFFC